jgi:hypothetical protein
MSRYGRYITAALLLQHFVQKELLRCAVTWGLGAICALDVALDFSASALAFLPLVIEEIF